MLSSHHLQRYGNQEMRLILAVAAFVMLAAPAQARPAGCPHAWCGCYLASHFGFTGALARKLWLARNWASTFPRASLAPGNVAVFSRGRGGHVGKIVDVRPGEVLLHSGNDGRTVRTRWRSTRGLIAVVSPSGGSHHNVAEKPRKARYASRKRPVHHQVATVQSHQVY